jgi:hypothetical protein
MSIWNGKKEKQAALEKAQYATEMENVLGTSDPKEQLERIKRLASPTATIVVQVGPQGLAVQAVGCALTSDDARMILGLASDYLKQKEEAARANNRSEVPQGPKVS